MATNGIATMGHVDIGAYEQLAVDGEFEDALAALQDVADRLEHAQVTLRDSMLLHGLSRRLLARCDVLLEEAEQSFRAERLDKPTDDDASGDLSPF
jgi:exodeoxyribonuclease VII small subunit